MPDHDALYHRLFSHPGMVAQLLREFVAEPWLDDLDLDAMQRVNARFHGRAGIRRDGDVIWRVKLKAGGESYLLLMLEFQSSSDRWMALRAMVYAGLLWQHVVQEKRLAPDGRLPPVFPVVIYNGDPRWAAPASLRPLIALPDHSPLWQWQPDMRYRVIDEGSFSDDDLARRDTLAALLFRLENTPEPDQIAQVVDAVIDWFRRHDGFEALKPMFAALAQRVIATTDGTAPGVRVAENLMEVKTMLANRPAEWKQRWTQEGLVQGREQGRRQGEASALTRLLERRFGPLSDAVRDRIASADLPALEAWSLRVLDAASVDEVLA
jgi:hypothetical protein